MRGSLKSVLTKILIYSGITVVVFTIFFAVPGFKAEISPLGNVLSAYFYCKHANSKDDATGMYYNHLRKITDPELKAFYKKFTWQQKDKTVEFNSVPDVTWELYDHYKQPKANYLQYWQHVRPHAQEFYRNTIKPVKVKYPVVHFRCSDSPFTRPPQYHLTKAPTVQWMAEQIKARGYDKVIMLNCNRHRRAKGNTCSQFFKFYAQIFKDAGIAVEKQCHTVYKDFAIMFYSPILVSLNTSSYAFMAGIAKDPQDYISCNIGYESDGEYLLQNSADWLQDTRAPLLHAQVKDYYDYKTVFKQLKE